jgi:hypothetical protein
VVAFSVIIGGLFERAGRRALVAVAAHLGVNATVLHLPAEPWPTRSGPRSSSRPELPPRGSFPEEAAANNELNLFRNRAEFAILATSTFL